MKKILIVTYYWPPSGGGGVQRWLKFAEYLPEYGWHPVIYTPENPAFALQDESLAGYDDEKITVLKTRIFEPGNLMGANKRGQGQLLTGRGFFSKLLLFIRGNLFIPDQRIFWVKKSVKFLSDYIRDNNIDAIATTGPPHSMHMIGLGLKRKTGIPWIADFRDPWTDWDILEKMNLLAMARKSHAKKEKAVVKEADLVISASRTWANDLSNRYQERVIGITNGFDKSDFSTEEHELNPSFSIGYYGMLNEFRIPHALLDALKELKSKDHPMIREIHLEFGGIISEDFIRQVNEDEVLKDLIHFKGYINHSDLMATYKKNFALLLIQNESENSKGHIPGKLFEYLAANRWILSQGNPDSETTQIILEKKRGFIYGFGDKAKARELLQQLWENFKAGNYFPPEQSIREYERKELTGRLATELEKISS